MSESVEVRTFKRTLCEVGDLMSIQREWVQGLGVLEPTALRLWKALWLSTRTCRLRNLLKVWSDREDLGMWLWPRDKVRSLVRLCREPS